MERERNREKVFQALNDALAHDKARTRILRISELGLVEMSRERVREDLYRALSEPCHYCEGRAYTKDPTTICYELFRDIRRLSPTPDERTIVIGDRKSTRLNSSHGYISYAVFCLKKKKNRQANTRSHVTAESK